MYRVFLLVRTLLSKFSEFDIYITVLKAWDIISDTHQEIYNLIDVAVETFQVSMERYLPFSGSSATVGSMVSDPI